MKHSSLNRLLEMERLILRDTCRPDFRIYTGNDLGINMIEYGSDYLLGLAAFAPDKFAERVRLWEVGDTEYYALSALCRGVFESDWTHAQQPDASQQSAAFCLGIRDHEGLCPAFVFALESFRFAPGISSARDSRACRSTFLPLPVRSSSACSPSPCGRR